MKQIVLTVLLLCIVLAGEVFASGYGVFTQGASGLGQANAVVAHPTGPSSLYFNPALMNDVKGRQFEVGTTAILSDRGIDYATPPGGSENGDSTLNFPSNFYYTHQVNEKLTGGVGLFFPFGLSNEWDNTYEGRYIGTSGEMFTMNINPALSYRVTDRLSLAAGVDFVYLDTELKAMLNQEAAYTLLNLAVGPLADPIGPLNDVQQVYEGDGWGMGYNLGALFKATDRISIGAAYRSQVDIDPNGGLSFSGYDPTLFWAFPEGGADTTIKLPAQFVAGVAGQLTDRLLVEVGVRWEDWDVNDVQTLTLQNPILGIQSSISVNRDWHSTWTYNIGGNYKLNDKVAINFGYLYGENAIPDSTFEPVIPDSDAHLFTVGTDLACGKWILSAAFGYEYHDDRTKNNIVSDPVGSQLATLIAGTPTYVGTANGEYATDIYLVGLSLGYKF